LEENPEGENFERQEQGPQETVMNNYKSPHKGPRGWGPPGRSKPSIAEKTQAQPGCLQPAFPRLVGHSPKALWGFSGWPKPSGLGPKCLPKALCHRGGEKPFPTSLLMKPCSLHSNTPRKEPGETAPSPSKCLGERDDGPHGAAYTPLAQHR